jgi:hypothetical protein
MSLLCYPDLTVDDLMLLIIDPIFFLSIIELAALALDYIDLENLLDCDTSST